MAKAREAFGLGWLSHKAKPMSRRLTLVTCESLNLDFRVKMGEGTLDTGRLKLPTMAAEKDPF